MVVRDLTMYIMWQKKNFFYFFSFFLLTLFFESYGMKEEKEEKEESFDFFYNIDKIFDLQLKKRGDSFFKKIQNHFNIIPHGLLVGAKVSFFQNNIEYISKKPIDADFLEKQVGKKALLSGIITLSVATCSFFLLPSCFEFLKGTEYGKLCKKNPILSTFLFFIEPVCTDYIARKLVFFLGNSFARVNYQKLDVMHNTVDEEKDKAGEEKQTEIIKKDEETIESILLKMYVKNEEGVVNAQQKDDKQRYRMPAIKDALQAFQNSLIFSALGLAYTLGAMKQHKNQFYGLSIKDFYGSVTKFAAVTAHDCLLFFIEGCCKSNIECLLWKISSKKQPADVCSLALPAAFFAAFENGVILGMNELLSMSFCGGLRNATRGYNVFGMGNLMERHSKWRWPIFAVISKISGEGSSLDNWLKGLIEYGKNYSNETMGLASLLMMV